MKPHLRDWSQGARRMLMVCLGLLLTTSFRQAGATQTNYRQVDLSPFSAKHLNSFPPGECWAEVPRGEQTFAGIPFRVVNVVELTGLGTARADNKFLPSRIENIPAECSGHRIHVLHGTGFDAPDGTPIAKLVLKYADGSAQPFYICYGVHTRNWWRERSEVNSTLSDPNSEVAWTCVRPGYSLRLFKTSFMNPYPERKISGIDLYSLLSRATPVILGITIEANSALSQNRQSDLIAVDETGLRREMRFRFVDSQEQPVKEVTAVLTITDRIRTYSYGTNRASAEGLLVVDYPVGQVLTLAIQAKAPAHVARAIVVEGSEDGNLPRDMRVQLEAGVRIGGFVRAPSGAGIPGARVEIVGVVPDPVGQVLESELDVAVSDDCGAWETRCVTEAFRDLSFRVSHPEFRPAEVYLESEGTANSEALSREALLENEAVLVLKPGIPVAGQVVDNTGTPLAGAAVFLRRHTRSPIDRECVADSQGRFKLVLQEEGPSTLVASLDGYLPASTNLAPAGDISPVRLKLQRGRQLRGLVLGDMDQPLSNAVVKLVSWRRVPFPRIEVKTGSDGRFTVSCAPADPADYEVSAPGYRPATWRRSVPAGQEEVIALGRSGLINGRVVDATDQTLIPTFTVVIGRSIGTHCEWHHDRPITGRDGRFTIDERDLADSYMWSTTRLLVEAEDYLPRVYELPNIMRSAVVTCSLVKGEGPHGTVRFPNGAPVPGAQVALVGDDLLILKGRSFDPNRLGPNPKLAVTDANGGFALPAVYGSHLIVAHPQGYAEAALNGDSQDSDMVLLQWGSIEGVVRNGGSPGTNITVMLTPGQPGNGFQYDWDTYQTVSDAQGRFVIKDAPPGRRALTRVWKTDTGWSLSHVQRVDVKPGTVTRVTYGGTGRSVVGQIENLEDSHVTKPRLSRLMSRMPEPPEEIRSAEEAEQWRQSPEFRAAVEQSRSYEVQVNPKGSFQVDEVAPGEYNLVIMFAEGNFGLTRSIQQRVDVPAGPVDEPVDLGDVSLSRPR